MSDLRHEVLTAQLERAGLRDRSPDESDLVGVRTAPGTPMLSRATSPLGSPATSPRPAARRLESRHRSRHGHDPLRRFPPEVAQRIFLSLPVDTLAQCSLVCRHWRRSATLNYAWFRHWEQEERLSPAEQHGPGAYVSPLSGLLLPPLGQGGAKWTKRQSRTDWKKAYIRTRRELMYPRDSLAAHGIRTGASRVHVAEDKSRSERMADAGILSATAWRQQQWAAEARDDQWTKDELRDSYKIGNKGGKVKGKSGKGGTRTWNEFAM